MNTRKKGLVALCLAATLGGLATLAYADKGIFRNIISTFRPPTVAEQQKLATSLQLTEEQKQALHNSNTKFRNSARNLREEYQKAYRSVVQLMQADSVNMDEVNRRLQKFNTVHQKIVDAEVRYWVSLKGNLTREQGRKLWEFFEQTRIRRR